MVGATDGITEGTFNDGSMDGCSKLSLCVCFYGLKINDTDVFGEAVGSSLEGEAEGVFDGKLDGTFDGESVVGGDVGTIEGRSVVGEALGINDGKETQQKT